MVKDETVVTCTSIGALALVAVTCAATGHDNGLLMSVISALATAGGVAVGRATKKTNQET